MSASAALLQNQPGGRHEPHRGAFGTDPEMMRVCSQGPWLAFGQTMRGEDPRWAQTQPKLFSTNHKGLINYLDLLTSYGFEFAAVCAQWDTRKRGTALLRQIELGPVVVPRRWTRSV